MIETPIQDSACPHCRQPYPPFLLERHIENCLVRLRRIGQPESAWQQWVRHVRGERRVVQL